LRQPPQLETKPIVLQSTIKPVILRADGVDVTRWMDALAIVVLVLVGAIAAATFRDYGLGWDDFTQSQYGQLLVSLYSSGFTDKRALSFVNLYMYGGGFDILATLAAKVLPFGLFETRRLVGAAIGIVGLFITWRLGRRVGGPLAGLLALILLATCPLYYGHMFINCKDAPFATAMIIALLGIVRAFDEYPRPAPATVALCGIGVGLAVGTRVIGGFAVLEALLPTVFIFALRWHASGVRLAGRECGMFLVSFIPGAVLAYIVMGLVWPWGVTAPFNIFRALGYFSHDFERPWRELFDGQLIPIVDMPRSYVPTLLAVNLPELMLALGLCGIVGVLVAIGRRGLDSIGRRAGLLAIVLAATLPVLLTIVTRPYIYNGIRHVLFIVPPLAVLGGLAGAWIAGRLQQYGRTALAAGAIALITGVASPVIDIVRLHPYEYSDFNHIIGGVQGARPYFMVDYWGLSLKQASQAFLAYLANHNDKPPNGQWKVAVCGPHPPVSVALGPNFDISWEPKGADFAMTLGEFYCAKLDAPLLFQIVRDGVVYARVYDIRGRSIPTLLTVPGV
jgi:Dolichyl-phosphate-mannose-protein mannosyltransferase